MVLTPKQENILLQLARYKFLTTSQMLALEIDSYKSNLSTALSRIKDGKRPLIKKLDFGLIPRKGRVEALYYLTKWGARVVEELLQADNIKYPLGRSVTFTSDYFHRVATISCEIALHTSPEVNQVYFSHRYFDQTGSNRTGDLSIDTKISMDAGELIADWIFMIETDVQQELYCAEIYMDTHDANRPYKSLRAYLQALSEGAPSIKFNFNRSNRVLALFGTERTMFSVLQKIQKDPNFTHFTRHFLFKHIDDLTGDFSKGWLTMEGEVTGMW